MTHLGILRLGNSSVEFGDWTSRESDDTLLCRARITTVAVDMETFAKQPIPPKWRAAFEPFVIAESQYPGYSIPNP